MRFGHFQKGALRRGIPPTSLAIALIASFVISASLFRLAYLRASKPLISFWAPSLVAAFVGILRRLIFSTDEVASSRNMIRRSLLLRSFSWYLPRYPVQIPDC